MGQLSWQSSKLKRDLVGRHERNHNIAAKKIVAVTFW